MLRKPNKKIRESWARIASIARNECDLREGLEAIVAYHIFGEEALLHYGDHGSLITAHRDVIEPLVNEAIARGRYGAR